MLKIRLKRLGRHKRPFYRIILINSRDRRQGAPIEILGYFNPLSRELKFDKAKALEWVSKGAQPSEVVTRLLKQAPENGELIVLDKAQREKLNKKAKARKAQEEEAAAAAAAAEAAAAPAEEPAAEEAPAEEAAAEEPAADAE